MSNDTTLPTDAECMAWLADNAQRQRDESDREAAAAEDLRAAIGAAMKGEP